MSDYSWIGPLIGKPWRAYASGPHAYDCMGVVAAGLRIHKRIDIGRDFGVSVGDVSAFDAAVSQEKASQSWRQLRQPVDGCVVLMSRSRLFHHIGMYLDVNGGRVLHSREGVGVALDGLHQLADFHRIEYWEYVCTASDSAAST